MAKLSRRSMLSLAAGTTAAALLPAVPVAETSGKRHWISSHWFATPLDTSPIEVIQVFQGERSDGRYFSAIRSIRNHHDQRELFHIEMPAHVDGFLNPDCICRMPIEGSTTGQIVSEQHCPVHKHFYNGHNVLKSSDARYRKENGSRAPEIIRGA